MKLTSEDILFVGKGTGVVPWYRTGMPALELGCDWVGMVGEPPQLGMEASLQRGGHILPKLDDYKIVILQQVEGPAWEQEIKRLRNKGVKVVYEVDDYLHGVRKIKSHRGKSAFHQKRMAKFEMCMRASDALICSTEWLAAKYAKFNERTFVCRNGVDAKRYGQFELPERKYLNIGWAGGEGHLESAKRWLPAIGHILDEFPETRFLSMGLPVANLLQRPKQAASLPFISIENFPAALCNFDIAIAPAGRNFFFAAKSDLRWLETGALGIPLVADPFVYSDIADRTTGMKAENAHDAETALRALVGRPELRQRISTNVKRYIQKHRSIEQAVESWIEVFEEVG